MNTFVKPKTEFVSDKEYIESLINANFKKDLHDNEEVCPFCHGTGMRIADNPYGLSDDPEKRAGWFPYQHQSLTFCSHCYNGVIKRCEHCGEFITRGYTVHNCEKQKEIDAQEYEKKRQLELIDAPLAPSDVLKKSDFFYSDDYGYNDGYFSEWEDFFEYWRDNCEDSDCKRPEYVWATDPVRMSINAADIIENATQDLYEDASDDISNSKQKELQDFLDSWCENCGVNMTYYQSKYKVRIPWENYDLDS